jgi:hypothetical protein
MSPRLNRTQSDTATHCGADPGCGTGESRSPPSSRPRRRWTSRRSGGRAARGAGPRAARRASAARRLMTALPPSAAHCVPASWCGPCPGAGRAAAAGPGPAAGPDPGLSCWICRTICRSLVALCSRFTPASGTPHPATASSSAPSGAPGALLGLARSLRGPLTPGVPGLPTTAKVQCV